MFDERVTPEFMATEELDYLKKVFKNKTDDYKILADEKVPAVENGYYLDGILYNDTLNKMVFLHLRTAFENKNYTYA